MTGCTHSLGGAACLWLMEPLLGDASGNVASMDALAMAATLVNRIKEAWTSRDSGIAVSLFFSHRVQILRSHLDQLGLGRNPAAGVDRQ